MAGATTIALIASNSPDIDWYIHALQNSVSTIIQHFSPHSLVSCAASDPQWHPLSGLPCDSLILVAEPVTESFYENLETALTTRDRRDLHVIALSVSQRSIFVAGPRHAVHAQLPLLQRPGIPVHHVAAEFAAAAKLRLVHDHLLAVHTVAAAEAMGLAARAGLNTSQVYDIIVTAAGHSTAFATRVQQMLAGDGTPSAATLDHTADRLSETPKTDVVGRARDLRLPLPLASAAQQLYVMAAALGHGAADDSALRRAYMPTDADAISEATTPTNELTPNSSPDEIASVGMVGLGAMGQGMAASLLRAGYAVNGFDVNPAAVRQFASRGPKARAASSVAGAVRNAAVVVLMVQNAAQVDDILIGSGNGAEALADHAVVILSSTVPPSLVRTLGARLQNLGRGISLLDAPVSGGVARAANGPWAIDDLLGTRLVALQEQGRPARHGRPRDQSAHGTGGLGAASLVKLVNQLLAGVHIAAAAEAMALAARLALPTRVALEILIQTDAWSWMLENRTRQMLENRTRQMLDADWTPHSALALFVKDLAMVLDEARRLAFYAPMAAAAHTLYLHAAAHGWEKDADSRVVRLWELTGLSVSRCAGMPTETASSSAEMNLPRLPAAKTLASLPPEYPEEVLSSIRHVVEGGQVPTLVILDDDPTGTQTCHDINVLAVWDAATLEREFRSDPAGFFILTNSRALPPSEARRLIVAICHNVKAAAATTGRTFAVVLRGDSTLRGHLPQEPEAVEEALGRFDGWVLAPFFSQGGRLTIDDVHYVQEADVLVPVSQTPFAQDATFGYHHANLRRYVVEKCGARFASPSAFLSITLDDIRRGGPAAVARKLLSAPPGSADLVVIVNAVADTDMHVFVAGLLDAERRGRRRYLFRTAAAFVSSRLGMRAMPPLTLDRLGSDGGGPPPSTTAGGLVLAGSYVPKTTAQLRRLRERRGPDALHVVELPVAQLVVSASATALVRAAAHDVSATLAAGKDVLVMTSRELVRGADALGSLRIGAQVAQALVALLDGVHVRPRYIIAKGGITSSDAATKALRMRRARVLGQAAPGVPLWVCTEETSRHRAVPYVVFPGNVGSDDTLADLVESWAVKRVL
ncbi:3-hydroxyacid dehydrogenase reductase [Cordyceps militaris]|uniref:3-hydroxyacid dehydrogenase reductase n=1 Tax=Cordyceps militaris TaxID=73501 RepID=A0A2H4SMF7_CORMI|nr:3-hydroxyacid dehydrogenase reductase [Cordyceps militaris]